MTEVITVDERPRTRSRLVPLLVVLALVLGVVLLRAFVAVPVRVVSASMEPELGDGDVVLVSRTAPDVEDLERGDLVVFADPRNDRRNIKRVIGLPGESVVILDGVLHVDDEPVEEPWIDPKTVEGYFTMEFDVPEDRVFVLGDNRGNSVDSRDYGSLPQDALEGRVLVGLWPPAAH